jgi:hypothetical protein
MDGVAAKLNRSGFQYVVARRSPIFGHRIKLEQNPKESIKQLLKNSQSRATRRGRQRVCRHNADTAGYLKIIILH